MNPAAPIEGECDPRFSAVRDAFTASFAKYGNVGAAICVYVEGRPVVDLWGGYADAARTSPWQRDTIVNVYSTTKGMTAICAHILVERGELDIDAPVATYWPEFAQGGKDDVSVRWLLSHQAGLPAISKPLGGHAMFDWNLMTTALAEQRPWWTPGTKHGYHALTFGWLVGEVVRRITNKSLGVFFRDEVAQPLGADFHIGLGPEYDARTAEVILATPPPADAMDPLTKRLMDPESLAAKSITNPPGLFEEVNTRSWRGAEIPAANGHGNARALARIYGALGHADVDGGTILRSGTIEKATAVQASGPDAVLPLHTAFGAGFFLPTQDCVFSRAPRAFGHPGAGGSLGFADPDEGLGFGFTMNQMITGPDQTDPRWQDLLDALDAAL